MTTSIASVAELGLALRAARRSSGVRLDDLATIAGVSKQFVSDVERGKPTVQLGLVLKLLDEVGVRLQLDLTASTETELEALRRKGGLRPPKKRGSSGADPSGSSDSPVARKV
jgi:transcriptional regulator with XRE-family HTH domain